MCDERERLIGYVYDEGDPRERAEIERHLETCAACRDEIRGLRSVRQDLLAWDVPAHESVWKPFAPARVAPSWRLVPAWALAAAASVMFLIGAAGGVVTHAFMEPQAPARAQAAAPASAPVHVVPAGIGRADLEAMRAQIVSTMRAEMDSRVRLVSTHTPTNPAVSDRLQQISALLKSGDQRDDQIMRFVVSLNNDLVTVTKRISSLQSRVDQLSTSLASVAQQQAGGKQ
jgi:hypothetical protein